MSRLYLVLLWHMHQPEYRDPATGEYLLPWTRLHALKDYYGMVALLEEFPNVHATFNLTPVLLHQIKSYAAGEFHEGLYELVFRPAAQLTREEQVQLLGRSFVGSEHLLGRFPRFRDLRDRVRAATSPEQAASQLSLQDWIDIQVLSQLIWMDEYFLAEDPLLEALTAKGRNFTEAEKQRLQAKEIELLGCVIPAYRDAAVQGRAELSTTPMYHPILPLLIDSNVAREANPHTRLPRARFAYPDDARTQLERALRTYAELFGSPPYGIWPAEGSVSEAVAELVAGFGIRWLASDEAILARSLAASGQVFAPEHRYQPYRLETPKGPVHFIFRDHQLSDLIGFVYSKMNPADAAADLHRRIRQAGEPLLASGRNALIALILDGENPWEYYPKNGRPFLREFYRRLSADPTITAVTVSEALAQWKDPPRLQRLIPGSWINGNFDIWIGHPEDHRAWELLSAARAFYAARAGSGRASPEQLENAYEALLVAESSDWCWWFGPEHQSSHDADFDILFRKYVSQVYRALDADPPDELMVPIKRLPLRTIRHDPTGYIRPVIDGEVTNYFEWLGAGLYAADRRSGALHTQRFYLKELHYGFDQDNFYLRVDLFPDVVREMGEFELRVLIKTAQELRLHVTVEKGAVVAQEMFRNGDPLPSNGGNRLAVELGKVLELRIAHELVATPAAGPMKLNVSFWSGSLPLDVLPAEGWLEIQLGEEAFAWRGV